MMQLVNKATIAGLSTYPKFFIQKRKAGMHAITFPRITCNRLKITDKRTVSFFNDDNGWTLFVNEDKDGFPFVKSRHDTHSIYSAGLVKMLQHWTKHRHFNLIKTVRQAGGGATVYQLQPVQK